MVKSKSAWSHWINEAGSFKNQNYCIWFDSGCQTTSGCQYIYSPPRYMGGDMLRHAARSLWVVPEWSLLFNVNEQTFSLQLSDSVCYREYRIWPDVHRMCARKKPSKCDGGLSPGLCCEITELAWHSYIQEDCTLSGILGSGDKKQYHKRGRRICSKMTSFLNEPVSNILAPSLVETDFRGWPLTIAV